MVGRAVLLQLCASLLLSAPALQAQNYQEAHDPRGRLSARLDSLQAVIADWTGSEERRREIREEIQTIRTRLEKGDFRPGDALRVRVMGYDELSGTYRLDSSVELQMGDLPPVSLSGVLSSEVEAVLQDSLSVYLRDPQVTVEPLLRVGVLGAVGSPGFYDLPPGATISDALMEAGGLASNAEVEKMKFGEDGRKIGTPGQDPTRLTLVDFAARSAGGNRIYVPQGGGGSFFGTLGPLLGIATSVTLILTRF